MKRLPTYIFALIFLIILFIGLPQLLHAQPGGGCDPLDPKCPIDGGLTALLVLGAGYGIKKVRDARKVEE
ncbi:MAG: PID-CTERM protein-sorting domain-containing protein [Ginsengibacter sp.]